MKRSIAASLHAPAVTQPQTESPTPSLPTKSRAAVPLWVAIGLVIFAIALALGPVARSGFSYWDDEDTISQNPSLNPPTWEGLADRWSRPSMHIYVPLTQTVWQVLALVSPKPSAGVGNVVAWPFKLTNLVVHAMTSVLVLMILRRLVDKGWPALLGAILFAIHPVQVEAVGWASGLKDLMFGLFSAGCILAYIGTDADRARPRGAFVAIALGLLVLAGLSKPTAMVVPVMLLTVDFVWLKRPVGQSIARLIPFAVVGLVFAVFARMVQPPVMPELQPSLLARPVVAVDVLAFYLGKLIWPTHLAYDYGLTPGRIIEHARAVPIIFALKVVLLMGIAGTLFLLRRRMPLACVGGTWFVIALTPVLGLTYFDFSHYSAVADHYLYLPVLGVSLVAAVALSRLQAHSISLGVAAVTAIALGVLAFRQSQTWHDAKSVTEQTLNVNDRSFASWSNLALAELRTEDPVQLEAAEMHAQRAVALDANDPQSMFVLANVLQARGDDALAIEWVRKAAKLSPYSAPYHHRLASLLGKTGHLDEAIRELARALELDPKYPNAETELKQLKAFARTRGAATQPVSDH